MRSKHYASEVLRTVQRIRFELHGAEDLAKMMVAEMETPDPVPSHEIDHDLPAYLVFLILANVKKLGEMAPDHALVKAVTDAVEKGREKNDG